MADARKKQNTGRIAALIAVGIPPLLLFLLGVFLLLGDSVITFSFALMFVVLPCAIFVGCYFVIRSKNHAAVKVILCVLLMIVMVILFVLLMSVGHFSILTSVDGEEAIELYRKDTESISEMPDISELGHPEKIEYVYFYNQMVTFFDSNCNMLFCQYSESDYPQEKEQLEERYVFQKEDPSAFGYTVPSSIERDGYRFRFLSFQEETYQFIYPKRMMMIATNDETHEVVYLFYNDDDLDWIESLEEHFLSDFGWKYIR